MPSKDTIKRNSTADNLKLLELISWKTEWNGQYFAEVRGFPSHHLQAAVMLLDELNNRKVDVKEYEELWNNETNKKHAGYDGVKYKHNEIWTI